MADDKTHGLDLGRAGSHVTHGGAGGLKRIEAGKELVGLAAREERKVEAELAEPGGRRAVVQRGAQRLEAVAGLYFHAVCTALDAGNIEQATAYVKVFAWVQAAAIRGMLAVDHVGEAEQLTLDSLLGRGADGED